MTQSHCSIEISGDAGLRAAKDIVGQLRQALAEHDAVKVGVDAITAADITTIQLLLAARKQAKATQKALSLTAAPSGAFRQLLIAAGFLSADGQPLTPEGDFWTPETQQNGGSPA